MGNVVFMGDCVFSKILKRDDRYICVLSKYFGNGKYPYRFCEGEIECCAVEHGDLIKAVDVYWDSEERKLHEMLRQQAKIENGIK